MAKRLPIRPKISKRPRLNVYKYWDKKQQSYVRCYGFELDLYDSISGTRIKRTVRADYQAAKAKYLELMTQLEEGNESLPTLIEKSKAQTLEELYEAYSKAKSEPSLRNRQVRSPLTIKRTRAAVTAFQEVLGHSIQTRQVKPEKIERFIKARIDQGRKKGGINADLRVLKALLSWALKREFISTNPFLAVEMFPAERNEPRPLTTDELERLFKVCPQGSRWYSLIVVYLLTGARLTEVLKPKLTWEDVDFENEMLTLPYRKGNKSSRIPMHSVLIAIFNELRRKPFEKKHDNEPEDVLYPFPINASYVSRKIKAIMNEAGIDATAHDLRDSFVSHLIYLGYPIEDVSKLAGHSTVRVTEKHYYGQIEERRRKMISDLGQHLVSQSTKSKKGTENRDIERSKVPNPDQSEEYSDDEIYQHLMRKIFRKRRVARDGIEPPTHGFSVHVPTVVKYKKGQENGARI